MRRISVGALLIALSFAAGGCGRPAFSGAGGERTSSAPVPALPAWARSLEGRPLRSIARQKLAACIGFVDGVSKTYTGTPPGTQISGWGWDSADHRPYSRILVTTADDQRKIVGAGDVTLIRPDVRQAQSQVTSDRTGFYAEVHVTSGDLRAWGQSGSDVCLIGSVTVK